MQIGCSAASAERGITGRSEQRQHPSSAHSRRRRGAAPSHRRARHRQGRCSAAAARVRFEGTAWWRRSNKRGRHALAHGSPVSAGRTKERSAAALPSRAAPLHERSTAVSGGSRFTGGISCFICCGAHSLSRVMWRKKPSLVKSLHLGFRLSTAQNRQREEKGRAFQESLKNFRVAPGRPFFLRRWFDR